MGVGRKGAFLACMGVFFEWTNAMHFSNLHHCYDILYSLVLCRIPETMSEWAQVRRNIVDLAVCHIQFDLPEHFGLSLLFGDAFPIGPKLLFGHRLYASMVTSKAHTDKLKCMRL